MRFFTLIKLVEDEAESEAETDDDEDDEMIEFVEQDIEHFKFKLFSVSRSLAVRIFSLNIQFYKWQDMVAVLFLAFWEMGCVRLFMSIFV
jgi:hypothetical protein